MSARWPAPPRGRADHALRMAGFDDWEYTGVGVEAGSRGYCQLYRLADGRTVAVFNGYGDTVDVVVLHGN